MYRHLIDPTFEDIIEFKPTIALSNKLHILDKLKYTDAPKQDRIELYLITHTWEHYNSVTWMCFLGSYNFSVPSNTEIINNINTFNEGKRLARGFLRTCYKLLSKDSKAARQEAPDTELDTLDRDHSYFYYNNGFVIEAKGPRQIPFSFLPLRDRMNLVKANINHYYTVEGIKYQFAQVWERKEDILPHVATDISGLFYGNYVWDYKYYQICSWPRDLSYIHLNLDIIKYSQSPLCVYLTQNKIRSASRGVHYRLKRETYDEFLLWLKAPRMVPRIPPELALVPFKLEDGVDETFDVELANIEALFDDIEEDEDDLD